MRGRGIYLKIAGDLAGFYDDLLHLFQMKNCTINHSNFHNQDGAIHWYKWMEHSSNGFRCCEKCVLFDFGFNLHCEKATNNDA